MKEKRKHQRVNISFPVECKELTQKGYFCTVSRDLSLGGARIIADDFFSKDDALKVNINLIDKIVTLKAKVIWCKKERTANRYSIGLEFLEMNDSGKRSLSHFLGKVH